MGKLSHLKRRHKKISSDPAVDQLAQISASNMFFSSLVGLGWRLGIMVLLPIFIGVKIDERLDSSPSVTLSAFFIAVFMASLFIFKTYSKMNKEVEEEQEKERQDKKRRLRRLLSRKKENSKALMEENNAK